MYFYLIQRYTILLIFNLQTKNKMHSSMDLWKATTVLPLRIRRSGALLQGKCTALIASLFAELSQSPHKCNGGRMKFSAKR